MSVVPENEPIRELEARDVLAVGAAVREGVRECRQALAGWLDRSEAGPVEATVSRAAARMLRSAAVSAARPPGPAEVLLVRLLLAALIEEMARPHVLTLN